jgi:hypothetical protein
MKCVQSFFDEMLEEEKEFKNTLHKAPRMEIPVSDSQNLPLCDVECTMTCKMEDTTKLKTHTSKDLQNRKVN